ncbi:Rotatin [Ooceraea biroi]|uniref:Rotatin n=1 Tax=Ooceraea biroi TaxID=2015173 RepID=A0A026VTP8_OOCBI|nr:Rotatin [Ooceraea biroi]
MLRTGRITAEHIKKLDHTIDEIRLRALDNIISKYDLGFVCDCDAIKKGIIRKLFSWFSFEPVPQPEKVLNFLLRLVQADANGYLNAFGKLRFQNDLHDLKRKISPKWHAKLDEIEKAILHIGSEINKSNTDSKMDSAININLKYNKSLTKTQDHTEYRNEEIEKEDQYESTNQHENVESILLEDGIRWLAMPWQPLVTSDKAVLAAVEEALNNTTDTNLILHTCQFIMNVMMQDFPAEVFLQRPAIVIILHSLLQSSASVPDPNVACVIPTVLKTLRKLTRALRFRIYYYCEPCIANKEQKLLADKLDTNVYASSEVGDPDSGVPEVNYQAYQSAGTSDRSQSINENIDDSALQSQQMLLPVYCIESLKYVLSQLNIPVDSSLPLRNVKYIVDLAHELVRLLLISITPHIWCYENETKIQNDLRMLFDLLGELMKHFCDWNNADYFRIIYLHLMTITMRLLRGLVPFNRARVVVPDTLRECIVQAEGDASLDLLCTELHNMICSYVSVSDLIIFFSIFSHRSIILIFDRTFCSVNYKIIVHTHCASQVDFTQLKGNIRFLYSPSSEIREKASRRLFWLVAMEINARHKLPRLHLPVHDTPLSSLCILKRKGIVKNIYNHYQECDIITLLEMLKDTSIEPQIRKSVLNQLNVIFANVSSHETVFKEDGLRLILDILEKALVEKDHMNYSDSVVPIISILKSIAFFDYSTRKTLSADFDVLINVLRSLLLFPNDKYMKEHGVQLLCLLAYGEHAQIHDCMITINEEVSLPYIVLSSMKVPFECFYFLKPKCHVQTTKSYIPDYDLMLSFLSLKLAWNLHGDRNILWKRLDDLKMPAIITEKLAISEKDLLLLQSSSVQYCCQKQLYNIQNSTTHNSVLCALDYLTMYLKFYEVLPQVAEDIDSLPWEQTFERFLLSHPTNKEDCDLFVDILNFLHLYLTIRKNGGCLWVSKIVKNMTRSLAELFKNMEVDNQNIHQFIFKLVRTCSAIEGKSNDESKNTWIQFVEFVVSTLCFGDQQHFYNLAYLDWLLTCLTYLINQCEWGNHKNLLISLCNTLIELIMSFHGAGTVSFMGLSITRNSIICLNHLLHQMQVYFNKNSWMVFWYEEGRSLSWLPMLWQNRDPLVRASALQLLAGLMNIVHTMSQLLNAIAMAPSDLCHTLLQCITNKEECCLVKEEACIAFSNMLKNCNTMSFHCDDSLQPQAILIYAEQRNIYHEIGVLCSNIYSLSTVDIRQREEINDKICKTLENVHGTMDCNVYNNQSFILPHVIWRLYYCQDELQPFSTEKYSSSDNLTFMQNYVTTPALITAVCILLNNLIFVGQHEVVRQIYEHSVDKYLFWCLDKIPKIIKSRKDVDDYSDQLEMYINICTVLTNSIRHSKEYTTIVVFSRDSLYVLFCFLDIDLYQHNEPRLIYLRNRLWTEIYNFVTALSLMENQHFETIQSALESCTPAKILASICFAIQDSTTDLRMSAISCLAFLLSLEIQNFRNDCQDDFQEKNKFFSRTLLDTTLTRAKASNFVDDNPEKTKTDFYFCASNSYPRSREGDCVKVYINEPSNEKQTIGGELCKVLLHLFTAYNYTKSKKNSKQAEDKGLVIGALANLLCVSKTAKQIALQNNLPETALMILKELYVKLNLQPFELYKKQAEKKTHFLLHDVSCIFTLLMNFMYGNECVKESLAKEGLADVVHKLWAWISLSKTVSISALKLLATFTETKCNFAAQSLTLTTIVPGSGVRKTPNTLALIHVIIQVICKETERTDQLFDNHKIHYAFHILRNAVHVHECRVSISKSNLLQLFTKIHPSVTKRMKLWLLIEMYYLEFLIDFTYYEEGQLCVPKATDALDVLIHLAKDSSSSIKILAISILRNLAFNITNRSRLLSSVDFINLLQDIFKNGSPCEVNLAGSILWSLVSNNQKGKLIARSAGLPRNIREAISRFTLENDVKETEPEVVKILLYVLSILNPDVVKSSDSVILENAVICKNN